MRTCMTFLSLIAMRNKTVTRFFHRSTMQMAVSVKKYCYHGNLTSQRPQNSPIMQFVTKSTQSHAQFLNGQWETAIPAGIYQP